MSSSELFRLCGVATILAGLLFVASDLLDLAVEPAIESAGFGAGGFEQESPSALLVFQSGLTLLAGVLLLFGSIGVYAHRTEEVGLLGLFGFLFAFSGTVMAVGSFWSHTFIAPTLAALAREPAGLLDAVPPRALAAGLGLSYGMVTVGWLLVGVAILRAGAYPRAGAHARRDDDLAPVPLDGDTFRCWGSLGRLVSLLGRDAGSSGKLSIPLLILLGALTVVTASHRAARSRA